MLKHQRPKPRTPRSGRGGRRFKSCHSDQFSRIISIICDFKITLDLALGQKSLNRQLERSDIASDGTSNARIVRWNFNWLWSAKSLAVSPKLELKIPLKPQSSNPVTGQPTASCLKHMCMPRTRSHVHALHTFQQRERYEKDNEPTQIRKVACVREVLSCSLTV